jgi:diguanylate cyclase (GGDEF)-like protein
LANRWRFNEELEASFARLKRDASRTFAVLMLDLDRFKPINDTHGHPAGDLVLRTMGERLSVIKRATDILCRLGGDEFALLAPDAEVGEAHSIAERMRAEVLRPINIGDIEVAVDVSIGVGMATEHSGDVKNFLKMADDAMYMNKRSKAENVVAQTAEPHDAP